MTVAVNVGINVPDGIEDRAEHIAATLRQHADDLVHDELMRAGLYMEDASAESWVVR